MDTYTNIVEYLKGTAGSVLVFVLRDVHDVELNRQVVRYENLDMKETDIYSAKFVVDELLTAKMVPGNYRLYLYVGVPKEGVETPTDKDYTLSKCLTEKGVQIRVRGALNEPSVGTNFE